MPSSIGALLLFDCSKDVTTGQYFLETDPNIQCFTTSGVWSQMVAPGVFCICLYVLGVPIILAAILWSSTWMDPSDGYSEKVLHTC